MKKHEKLKFHIICNLMMLGIIFFSTVISFLLNRIGIEKENLLMVFLVGVLLTSVYSKRYIYGLITSTISVFVFNYFFTDPLYTFLIKNKQDLLLLIFFLITALIGGSMSSKLKMQTEIARKQEKNAKLMYDTTRNFMYMTGTSNIIDYGAEYIFQHTGCLCKIEVDGSKFGIDKNVFSIDGYDEKENEYNITKWPIIGVANRIGTVSVLFKNELTKEIETSIKSIIYHMALVLDRELIYTEREKIKLAMESEHLKSTLLRSISHDLRTPLTGIVGSSSLILENYDNLSDLEILNLVTNINEESYWLNNTVTNILNMTRIQDGKLVVLKQYEAIDDLVNQAVSRVYNLTKEDRLKVTMPDNIVLIEVDGKLMVQLLVNLLDNAYKHSGDGTLVELKCYVEKSMAVFEVSDNGVGIDESIMNNLFKEFVKMPHSTSDIGRGVGLGLSICKAIVDAHGGIIEAYNKDSKGAMFKVQIPYKGD